jgi:hypothetical protein
MRPDLRPGNNSSAERHRTVIVAVPTVYVVKVALDEVVGVITVRHGLVPTAGPVSVGRVVSLALVVRRTCRRVRLAHRDRMLLDPRSALMMQVAVVKVVLMAVVLDGRVPATGAMNVRMARLRMLRLRL